MGENKSRIKALVPQSLVDSYGEYAAVVNYLLVLAETPQMGVMVTSSVHELYQRQNEVGKKSLFEGASRFWESLWVGRKRAKRSSKAFLRTTVKYKKTRVKRNKGAKQII